MIYFFIALFITAGVRGALHVIIHEQYGKFDRSVFSKLPEKYQKWLLGDDWPDVCKTCDGFHILAGLNEVLNILIGIYFFPSNPLDQLIYGVLWFHVYFSFFNLFYHRWLVLKNERSFIRCLTTIGWVYGRITGH